MLLDTIRDKRRQETLRQRGLVDDDTWTMGAAKRTEKLRNDYGGVAATRRMSQDTGGTISSIMLKEPMVIRTRGARSREKVASIRLARSTRPQTSSARLRSTAPPPDDVVPAVPFLQSPEDTVVRVHARLKPRGTRLSNLNEMSRRVIERRSIVWDQSGAREEGVEEETKVDFASTDLRGRQAFGGLLPADVGGLDPRLRSRASTASAEAMRAHRLRPRERNLGDDVARESVAAPDYFLRTRGVPRAREGRMEASWRTGDHTVNRSTRRVRDKGEVERPMLVGGLTLLGDAPSSMRLGGTGPGGTYASAPSLAPVEPGFAERTYLEQRPPNSISLTREELLQLAPASRYTADRPPSPVEEARDYVPVRGRVSQSTIRLGSPHERKIERQQWREAKKRHRAFAAAVGAQKEDDESVSVDTQTTRTSLRSKSRQRHRALPAAAFADFMQPRFQKEALRRATTRVVAGPNRDPDSD